MDDVPAPERELVRHWAPELVALSYLVSWLGAYTSTQIMIHAKYTRRPVLRWTWTAFASVAFGFCAIWSMHFVSMLACRLDVNVTFNIPWTIFSAFIAVIFTFAALSSPYASEAIENSVPIVWISRINHRFCLRLARVFAFGRTHEHEHGYAPLDTDDRTQPVLPVVADSPFADENDEEHTSSGSSEDHDEDLEALRGTANDAPIPRHHPGTQQHTNGSSAPAPHPLTPPRRLSTTSPHHDKGVSTSTTATSTLHPDSRRESIDSSPDSTSTSNSDGSISMSFTHDATLTSTTTSSSSVNSWNEPLRHVLSREARLRIRARAKERPIPHFGFRYWCSKYWNSVNPFLFIRAAVWAAAIVFMHYSGMWAMEIPEGRIEWSGPLVALSYAVAVVVCFVGCLAMSHMESHFGQQIVFSTIASAGCSSMHYTGMAAATFYTRAAPVPDPGYPAFLPVVIRNVERAARARGADCAEPDGGDDPDEAALWRIMAEKEAAEQAIELKQQFISVASHEFVDTVQIRTPLHTVNGYCELLVRTELTEEQSLYVTSIQQACHAINVIAGNVLVNSTATTRSFRSAVLMEVRKMLEDVAKITEARGIQPGSPKGTGLGLSIVKHLVQRMGGTVDVDSTEGEGTTFTVELPVMLHSRSPSPTSSRTHPHKEPERQPSVPVVHRRRRVRVVYRDTRTQKQYLRLWAAAGHTACAGAPSASASELAAGVDVIWTDTETAVGSPGLRALMRVKEQEQAHGTARVAVFVVHSDAHDLAPLDDDFEDGAAVVLVKRPVVMHTVAEWVEAPEGRMGAHVRQTKVRFALPAASDTDGDSDGETDEEGKDGLLPPPAPALREKAPSKVVLPGGASANGQGVLKATGEVEVIPLSPVQAAPVSARPLVLLVEDNQINQRLGQRLLEKLGYAVATANDGQQALDAVRQTEFVCCLMDCQMPVLDGFGATRKIRELEARGTMSGRLPIIALTANVTHESEDECKAAGMDHFLPKPLKMNGAHPHSGSHWNPTDPPPDLDDNIRRLRRTVSSPSP
ncbi:uncharacterized protein BXZ73DRAFT_82448 [Epithele typhae]|uniref:uncharacterized protein n=1 Tax=Epithele typhae TaxID=378194 RepID=UPI0020075993|nr:uncharacterized protein BXZ73DRAFT_82448 [Epithele typhae]KAH9912152.1 hypothetical protein BXZ73DRAFT_82448 [Epithele typhae]